MGIPIRELLERISSVEFAEYYASLSLDPDVGTRLDYLLSYIAVLITRLEAAIPGGQPPQLSIPLIPWGQPVEDLSEETDGEGLIRALARAGDQANV